MAATLHRTAVHKAEPARRVCEEGSEEVGDEGSERLTMRVVRRRVTTVIAVAINGGDAHT